MQYSPKLKKAMEEIKGIIKRYDVGAVVVLHLPNNSEFYQQISPTYSCAKHNGDHVRIRAKLADFNGDKEAWTKKVTDTSNMLNLLGTTAGKTAMMLLDVSEQLDKIIDAEHGNEGLTSHTTQNN